MKDQHNVSNGKPQTEIFLELAKLSEHSIDKRKDVEWKVNLAFWTAIGIFSWFGTQYIHVSSVCWWILLGVCYLAIFVIWIMFWQIPLHGAYQVNRLFKHYYAEMAEGIQSERPNKQKVKPSIKNYWRLITPMWLLGQTSITLVFLVLSFMVLILSNIDKISTSDRDSLQVSGKNLEIILQKISEQHKE